MKKKLFVVLALLLCATLVIAQGVESEPNDTFDQANPFGIPGTISGSINPMRDHDFYSLTTQAGLSYQARLSISSVDELILRMRIYDADQHLQGTSSSSYTSIEHKWTAYTPGTYLQIHEFDPTTSMTKTASYTLTVQCINHFVYFPWATEGGIR